MDNQELIIAVKNSHLQSMPEIAEKLKKVGLTNIQSMPKLGIITGSIPENQIQKVEQIEGIDRVEKSREIFIAAPDSSVQ